MGLIRFGVSSMRYQVRQIGRDNRYYARQRDRERARNPAPSGPPLTPREAAISGVIIAVIAVVVIGLGVWWGLSAVNRGNEEGYQKCVAEYDNAEYMKSMCAKWWKS